MSVLHMGVSYIRESIEECFKTLFTVEHVESFKTHCNESGSAIPDLAPQRRNGLRSSLRSAGYERTKVRHAMRGEVASQTGDWTRSRVTMIGWWVRPGPGVAGTVVVKAIIADFKVLRYKRKHIGKCLSDGTYRCRGIEL